MSIVPPSRPPTRSAVSFVRRPLVGVIGVVAVLATLVFLGGGGIRGIESALWSVVGLIACSPSDYSAMDALESDVLSEVCRRTPHRRLPSARARDRRSGRQTDHNVLVGIRRLRVAQRC